jgi:hypothetical protein
MTKYVQKPTGWWQDSNGAMQPPGSYLDPTLRVPPEPAESGSRSSAAWMQRVTALLPRRGVEGDTPAARTRGRE